MWWVIGKEESQALHPGWAKLHEFWVREGPAGYEAPTLCRHLLWLFLLGCLRCTSYFLALVSCKQVKVPRRGLVSLHTWKILSQGLYFTPLYLWCVKREWKTPFGCLLAWGGKVLIKICKVVSTGAVLVSLCIEINWNCSHFQRNKIIEPIINKYYHCLFFFKACIQLELL